MGGHDVSSAGPTRDDLAAAADALIGRLVVEGHAKAWWACWLAKLFPHADVVVAAPTKKDVGRIVDELNGRFGIPARGRNDPGPARVLVTTHASVGAFAAQGTFVLVLVDAHRAVADAYFHGVQRVLPFARRVYGLVPAAVTVDPLTAARLDLVTGDVLGGDGDRGRLPEVTVVFARSAGGRVRRTTDARERNEAAYWGNAERNRRVVELSRAVAAGDEVTLTRLGVDGNKFVTPECDKVVVLAGSVDQAEHLGRLLGWPVRTAVPGAADKKVVRRNIVVTAAYAVGHDLDAGVVVRADGGHGPLAVPGLTRVQSAEKVVAVVDLDDRFDEPARDDTRRRRDGYRRQGFRVMRGTPNETQARQRA